MQGMSKYAEEMEEGALYAEFIEGYYDALDRNADYTDNKAYAVISYYTLDLEGPNGEKEVYWHGDVISGNDWNNNGKIDLLEELTTISYRGVEIRHN